MVCAGKGSGGGNGADVPFGCYQIFGDLWITQEAEAGDAGAYRRSLSLEEAVARTVYAAGGVEMVREVIASFADDVVVVRIWTASNKPMPRTTIRLDRDARHAATPWKNDGKRANPPLDAPQVNADSRDTGLYVLQGQLGQGMRYGARMVVRAEGVDGAEAYIHQEEHEIRIAGASAITIHLALDTDYAPAQRLAGADAAALKTWEQLRADHVAAYRACRGSAALALPEKADALPTDERLAATRSGKPDTGLDALFFHYGQYLLLCSSRPAELLALDHAKYAAPSAAGAP